jgi:hypothetical protein
MTNAWFTYEASGFAAGKVKRAITAYVWGLGAEAEFEEVGGFFGKSVRVTITGVPEQRACSIVADCWAFLESIQR